VIVEMSGLGDPAPLINALNGSQYESGSMRDRTIDSVFHLAGFVTLYDIVTGGISIERHFEALKQVAFADRIVLTKTDLAKDPATRAEIAALPGELRAINASAEIVDRRNADLLELFSPRPYSVVERGDDVAGWLALETALAAEAQDAPQSHFDRPANRHGPGIRTFSIIYEQAIPQKRFQQFLAVLQNAAGPRLLRVKGVVSTREKPEQPLLVHAVQHVLSDPVELEGWPDDDRRTRLVFITSDIDPEPVRDLFSAVIDGKAFSFSRLLQQLGGGLAALLPFAVSQFTNFSRRSI
jgi:G3E family GTPase